jgi:hypothetical protein
MLVPIRNACHPEGALAFTTIYTSKFDHALKNCAAVLACNPSEKWSRTHERELKTVIRGWQPVSVGRYRPWSPAADRGSTGRCRTATSSRSSEGNDFRVGDTRRLWGAGA